MRISNGSIAGGRGDFVEEAFVAEGILQCAPARVSTPPAAACRASQCAVSLLFGKRIGNAQPRVVECRRPEPNFGSLASTAASSVAPERLHRPLGQEDVGLPRGDPALVIDLGAVVEQ